MSRVIHRRSVRMSQATITQRSRSTSLPVLPSQGLIITQPDGTVIANEPVSGIQYGVGLVGRINGTVLEIASPLATSLSAGRVKPDNTTTFVSQDGTMSAVGGGGGGGVTSVNGHTGVVVLAASDVGADVYGAAAAAQSAAEAASEPALGNPSSLSRVLTSTTSGVRSWAAIASSWISDWSTALSTWFSGVTAGGDLSGSYPNPTVGGIRGVPIDATSTLYHNSTLMYDELATEWYSGTPLQYYVVGSVATANISSLSGYPTIDGYVYTSVDNGATILLVGQSTRSQNGPWQVFAGAWQRPRWYKSGASIPAKFVVTVILGTVYGNTTWRLQIAGYITPDTTTTTWIQMSIPGSSGALLAARNLSDVSSVNASLQNLLGLPSSEGQVVAGHSAGGVYWTNGAPSRSVTTVLSSSLAPYTGNVNIGVDSSKTLTCGKTAQMLYVSTNAPATIRLYATSAGRTADLNRSLLTPNPVNVGLLAEIDTGAGALSPLPRPVNLTNGDISANSYVYATIYNLSGSTQTITGTFEVLTLEA